MPDTTPSSPRMGYQTPKVARQLRNQQEKKKEERGRFESFAKMKKGVANELPLVSVFVSICVFMTAPNSK